MPVPPVAPPVLLHLVAIGQNAVNGALQRSFAMASSAGAWAGTENRQDIKQLTLIRHGESQYNHWRRSSFTELRWRDMIRQDPGFVDAPLTEDGNRQADTVAKNWTGKDAVELIITSPLRRSLETALRIFGTPPQPSVERSSREEAPSPDGRSEAVDSMPADWSTTQATPSTGSLDNGSPNALGHPCIVVTPLATEWLDTLGDTGMSFCELRQKYQQFPIDWSVWEKSQWPKVDWWYHGSLGPIEQLYRFLAPEPRSSVLRRIEAFERFLRTREERNICIVGHSWFFKLWTGDTKASHAEVRSYSWDSNSGLFLRHETH